MTAAEVFSADESEVEWREFAVCSGRTNLFFAKKAERPEARVRREARARALCDICPVQPDCKQFARINREYGYWGGETEEERHLAGFTLTAPIGARIRVIRDSRPADNVDQILSARRST